MPLGILSEIYLGFPPAFVLVGAASIVGATALFALELARMDLGGAVVG